MAKELDQLRVAACQILTYPDVAASADKVLGWMERAAADGVDGALGKVPAVDGVEPGAVAGAGEEAARPAHGAPGP